MKKKKKRGLIRLLSALAGFACALVLGALFYGTMVYQLAGESDAKAVNAGGALLALSAPLEKEETQEISVGGQLCRVVTRTYLLDGGIRAEAISATPAAYFERLAEEGFVPQLVTGFSLAGLDAVCERRGEEGVLAAREGDYVYLLKVRADDQVLYALGAGAALE